MTTQELEEYNKLADKRESGKLSNKEWIRWKQLVNKSFEENLQKVISNCLELFNK